MTPKEARAAGYNVTQGRPIGSTRAPWGIITNVNHPSGKSGEWIGGYFATRREALQEVEDILDLDHLQNLANTSTPSI